MQNAAEVPWTPIGNWKKEKGKWKKRSRKEMVGKFTKVWGEVRLYKCPGRIFSQNSAITNE